MLYLSEEEAATGEHGAMRIMDDVAFVSAGSQTIVIKKDGTAWTWGRHEMGLTGDGVTIESAVPIQIDNRLFVRNP